MHSNSVFRGTEGEIQFLIAEDEAAIRLSWDVPFFGTAKTAYSGPATLLIERTEKLGNLTEVHFAVSHHERVTVEGASTAALASSVSSPHLTERWKSELKSAPNSVLFSIHNTSPFALQLCEHDISRGHWKAFPPETVESGERVQFGAESHNRSGSQGFFTYALEIITGDHVVQHLLPLSWTFTGSGSLKPEFQHRFWSLRLSPPLHSPLSEAHTQDPPPPTHHFEIELSLSSEEAFILDSHFTPIEHPTFDANETILLESTETTPSDGAEEGGRKKEMNLHRLMEEGEDTQDWDDSILSNLKSYPSQLELLD